MSCCHVGHMLATSKMKTSKNKWALMPLFIFFSICISISSTLFMLFYQAEFFNIFSNVPTLECVLSRLSWQQEDKCVDLWQFASVSHESWNLDWGSRKVLGRVWEGSRRRPRRLSSSDRMLPTCHQSALVSSIFFATVYWGEVVY